MITSLIGIVFVLLSCYIANNVKKPRKFPPGPKWYPFIGTSNIVYQYTKRYGSQFHALLQLSKEYSKDILGLKLGNEPLVVVFGEKNVRQVLTSEAFEGRPDSFFLRLRSLGKRLGVTFTDGAHWKLHRQFTLTQLKNVGFGKTHMEKEIQNELIAVLEYIKNNRHKPICPSTFISQAVMNVLWMYVAGEKIGEEKWAYIQNLFTQRSKAFSMAGGLLNLMPWCRYIIPNFSGYSLIADLNRQISDIIENAINKHKNKEIPGHDFMYAFLEHAALNNDTFTEDQLKVVCLDLIIAGSQTTSNLLEFALMQVIRNKSIQGRIHEEIDTVLGNKLPCWTDSSRLVYTSAFLLELQRYNTIAPLAGPRRVQYDTYIDEYLIPKDTTVLISLGDIHANPDFWIDPHVFRPERFIDGRGLLKPREHFYPFGLGRRRCPGDSLAKSFVFLMFVGILQKYHLTCSDEAMPSDESNIGLIASPKPYKADFIPRNQSLLIL